MQLFSTLEQASEQAPPNHLSYLPPSPSPGPTNCPNGPRKIITTPRLMTVTRKKRRVFLGPPPRSDTRPTSPPPFFEASIAHSNMTPQCRKGGAERGVVCRCVKKMGSLSLYRTLSDVIEPCSFSSQAYKRFWIYENGLILLFLFLGHPPGH